MTAGDHAKRNQVAEEARAFLRAGRFGVLSTHGSEPAGYPFGSVAPYSLDEWNRPVILISSIAAHTRNIQADERVSLIVLNAAAPDVQADSRLTVLANARPVPARESELVERHGRFFPTSREYHKTHDFAYYRLEPVRLRWIGGFGRIGWIEPEEFRERNPFFGDSETRILEHMNADHRDAMLKYCARHAAFADTNGPAPDCEIVMTGIDARGFDLLLDGRGLRFEFPEAIQTAEQARAALIALARE